MKKILFLLSVFLSAFAFGQVPGGYLKQNVKSNVTALFADSGLHVTGYNGIPYLRSGVSTRSSTFGIDTTNHRLYIYSDAWIRMVSMLDTVSIIATKSNIVAAAGEINTGSNLGGGLANFSGKSGVDLQFNSFTAADFNLASNLLSIDYTNGQAAATGVKGFLTGTDWDTFNSKQPGDADLTTIAGLTATTNNFIQSVGSAWASRTPTQATATLDIFTTALKGLVPPPVTSDGTKFINDAGVWAVPTGSGADETADRGLAETSNVFRLNDYYRSQVSPAEQSAYIPSLLWEARDATTRNFWQDGSLSVSINDTLFNIGGYTLGTIGRINDTIAYSVDNALNFSVSSKRFPYAIANATILKARFPGDWNYILGNGFTAANMDGVIRFKTIWDFDTMTVTASYGNLGIFGAVRDEDGYLYVIGGQTSSDSSTTTGDMWRSKDGGVTWTQIQTDVEVLRGNLLNAAQYRDGYIYLINARQRYDATEGEKTYTSEVYKIPVIYADDGTKWKRINDAPASVGATQFITTEVFNGQIWVSSGTTGVNTNGIAYLDKNDVWHTYNNYTGIETGTALESQHASSFAVHRNSLYRLMGSSTNQTYVLKDSNYLASHFVTSYIGAGYRSYFGETKSSQGLLAGNGVTPGSTTATIKRVTSDTEQPFYNAASTGIHRWGFLNAGNSTLNADVAVTTGQKMWLESVYGILKLSSNPSFNVGGLLQVDGGAGFNNSVRLLAGDLSVIQTGRVYLDGDLGGEYITNASATDNIDVYTNNLLRFKFNPTTHLSYRPIDYFANYGIDFTARSLVDKGYVDSAITAGGVGGGPTEVFGTADRITVANGTTTPTVDISATFEALLVKLAGTQTITGAKTFSAVTTHSAGITMPNFGGYELEFTNAAGNTNIYSLGNVFLNAGAAKSLTLGIGDGGSELTITSSSITSSVSLIVPAETFGAGWDSDNGAATKNDIYDWGSALVSFTDEGAQDAVGLMVDATLVYVDATPLLTRAALSGDITAPQASNVTTLATVNANVGSFTNANITVDGKGRITAAANGSAAYTDEQAQDAVGTMINASLQYVDATPLLAIGDRDFGDFTFSGSGLVGTIDAGVVSLAKMADVATATVFYRKTAATGVPEVQTLATLKTDLGLTSTNSGDVTLAGETYLSIASQVITAASVNLSGTHVTGDLPFSKITQLASQRLAGNSTGGAADIQEISLGSGLGWSGTSIVNTGIITEVDGSTTNELQTLANTSAATTHTLTLSNSGGSIQLAEGSGITLTTTGTGLDGIVTIAATGGSGVTTMAAIGSAPNANAATISGVTLNLEPASGSFGGVVTTGPQSFAGVKTYSAAPLFSAGIEITNGGGYEVLLKGNAGANFFSEATTPANAMFFNTAGGNIYFGNADGGQTLRIINGQVGIDKAPSVAFDVSGAGAFTGAVTGAINAYDATTWNASAKFATEDAVRDKIESLSSGAGTVNTGAANKIAYYPGAGTTVDDLTDLEYSADGTNDHFKLFSLTKMVQLGARTSGTSYPGIWFGNITPSFTNYAFLYDVNSGTILNTPASSAFQMRVANTNVWWTHPSGGISVGVGNYATDPGASNVLVEGEARVADEAYDATGWNGDLSVPTKNAVRDKIEALGGGVTPAALTKADDTNVTLTLGGTPSTALLQGTSITAGWTGVLSEARGGTDQSTYTVGDILYSSSTNNLSKRGIGATEDYLSVSGGVPVWSPPSVILLGQDGGTIDNVTTGETDLHAIVIAANRLDSDEESVYGNFSGSFNDNGATTQLRVYWNGSGILNTGVLSVVSLSSWDIDIKIMRTSSTTARAMVRGYTPGCTTALFTVYTLLTSQDFTTSNTLKVTGQAGGGTGGSGDISSTMFKFFWANAIAD